MLDFKSESKYTDNAGLLLVKPQVVRDYPMTST